MKPTVIMIARTSAIAFQSRKLRRRFSSQFIGRPVRLARAASEGGITTGKICVRHRPAGGTLFVQRFPGAVSHSGPHLRRTASSVSAHRPISAADLNASPVLRPKKADGSGKGRFARPHAPPRTRYRVASSSLNLRSAARSASRRRPRHVCCVKQPRRRCAASRTLRHDACPETRPAASRR